MERPITKRKAAVGLAMLLCLGLSAGSCSHYDELMSNPMTSKHGDDESHNAGKNCMTCHKSGGEAVEFFDSEKMWNIGGTVYNPDGISINANGNVYLYTQPNGQGQLRYTLEVDALGNFYTNQIIDFREGLFPYVVGGSGGSAYMGTKLTSGACNSCHGVSTPVITIN